MKLPESNTSLATWSCLECVDLGLMTLITMSASQIKLRKLQRLCVLRVRQAQPLTGMYELPVTHSKHTELVTSICDMVLDHDACSISR